MADPVDLDALVDIPLDGNLPDECLTPHEVEQREVTWAAKAEIVELRAERDRLRDENAQLREQMKGMAPKGMVIL